MFFSPTNNFSPLSTAITIHWKGYTSQAQVFAVSNKLKLRNSWWSTDGIWAFLAFYFLSCWVYYGWLGLSNKLKLRKSWRAKTLMVFKLLFSLLLSILCLAGSWILLQGCKHPTSLSKQVVTTTFYQTISFITKNQNLPKSSLFKCYDSNLHWWLSPKAFRSQSSANRELSIFRRYDPCVDHKVDPDLHELEGPDGSEEVLLWLVARHILLQRLWALSELKISEYRILIQMWYFGIILVLQLPHVQRNQSSDICCQGYPWQTWRYLPT